MNNKLIPIVITLVVGIILAGSVLMPVLNDASKTENTLTNEGYYTMDKLLSTDEAVYSFAWDATNGTIVTVNGTDMDITTWGLSTNQLVSVFASETDIIRLGVASGQAALQWVQIRGSTINYAGASSTFSATISEGTVTAQLDSEESPRTLTYDTAYFINNDGSGDYVMKKSDKTAYMLADTPIYAIGTTGIMGSGVSNNTTLKIEGDIEGVEISTLHTPATGDVTYEDVNIVYTPNNKYVGLYDFSKITFKGVIGDDSTDIVYSYVIVPKEVTAELSEHLTPGQIALMGAIPVLVIVALLVVAVGVVARRNE